MLNTQWFTAPKPLVLPDDGVHAWRVSLSRTPSELRNFLSLLAPDEVERAARYHFERDREHFIAARGTLRTLLGLYLNRDPARLSFSYSSYGKPAIISTDGTQSIGFNLAHSHEIALLAFTRKREIGVDIEYLRAESVDEKVAENLFSAKEVATLRTLSSADRVEAFFNCWTRKEAYIKARGEGLSFPLDQFDVSMLPGDEVATLNVPSCEVETARWSIQPLRVEDGYVGAIAVEGHGWKLECWQG